MSENQELLEKAIVNLTIENAKLKNEVDKYKLEADRNWKWYMDQQKLTDQEKKEKESLEIQKKNILEQNQKLRRNAGENISLIEVNTEEETE